MFGLRQLTRSREHGTSLPIRLGDVLSEIREVAGSRFAVRASQKSGSYALQ